MSEVIQGINNVSDNKTPDDRVKQLFSALWQEFEKSLEAIPDQQPSEKHMRPQHEILEELVTGVRGLDGRMRDIDIDMSERGPISSRRKFRRLHPMMFEEITHRIADRGDDPISLLIIAGLFREDFPWLSEIIIESYRDIKNGGPEEVERAIHRLHRTNDMLQHGPFMAEFIGDSKEADIIMMELPMMLDRALHRYSEHKRPSKRKIIDSDDE